MLQRQVRNITNLKYNHGDKFIKESKYFKKTEKGSILINILTLLIKTTHLENLSADYQLRKIKMIHELII